MALRPSLPPEESPQVIDPPSVGGVPLQVTSKESKSFTNSATSVLPGTRISASASEAWSDAPGPSSRPAGVSESQSV